MLKFNVIIDAFPFLDEIDLAVLRIKYLSRKVDLFVVSEFNVGFSGKEKDYLFPRVLSKLPYELKNKIYYAPQKQNKLFSSTFLNDHFQKNSLKKILLNLASSKDHFFFGDLDEFPNLEVWDKLSKIDSSNAFFHLAQDNFLGYLNLIEKSHLIQSHAGDFPHVRHKKWLGTIFTSIKALKEFSITELRDPQRKLHSTRISNGGWHFSFCGGENSSFKDRFIEKMKHSAHQEFNNSEILTNALNRISRGMDPFERRIRRKIGPFIFFKEPEFEILNELEHLPLDLAKLASYRNLIAKNI